ncbi:hypothetical protein CAPTEDRAFT_209996 [Capitella teleta]|uniref:RNA helicase n=1 Tax=Capitella teleta TaxID=283909 RepID=R7VEQ8_CAPTE|nr:hypothetical protein CAPTEDRAFT_209996 [Capitella teleta]|eukprot:ELU14771.1 hypothetical protein CAPTEDRAFT_209996 [Capitella teleta]
MASFTFPKANPDDDCASSIFSSEDGDFERPEDMKKIDEQNRWLIDKVFRPILRDRIIPTNFLKHLRIIKEKGPDLVRLERNLPRPQVVDEILNSVLKSEKKQWFEVLLEALQKAGYAELKKLVLSSGQIQKKEMFHRLMQHCYDLLLDEACPEELVSDLLDAKVIDEDDANDVVNMICEDGSRAGMSLIMCRIAQHSATWFTDLTVALQSSKNHSLVEKLKHHVLPEEDVDKLKNSVNDLTLDGCQTQPKLELNILDAESSVVSNDRVPNEEDEDAEEATDEDEDIRTGIRLRSYQLELVNGVGDVKNSLIVAPTGCGKTFVAAEIIKQHMVKNPNSKVIFLVPTVALVQQQHDVLQSYSIPDARIKPISGEGSQINPLKNLIQRHNIMVMTPQILVNACDHASLLSFGIGLLIFDECHHSMKEHPYSKIMALYHDLKPLEGKMPPRIVGMTASVGVGKAKNEDDAIKHIIRLLANMDAHLVSVVDCKEDLAFCVNKPQENLVYLKKRNSDPFYVCIHEIMVTIENRIENYNKDLTKAQARLGKQEQIKPPAEKGSLLYKQWHSAFAKRLIVNVENESFHFDLVCCAEYLKIYNDALLINSDCRSLDALEYLKEKVKHLLEMRNRNRDQDSDRIHIKQWLAKLYTDKVEDLERFCDDPNNANPKLETLKKYILKKKREEEPMRCMVFCQTREICSSLVRWANSTDGLVDLRATFLTGSNAAADKKGLTSSQQNDVIKSFANGRHQLIFATTVAEEGLDIQACDNVIRYQYVTSMTARIQSRGRARKSEASFTLLATSKEAQRDEMNSIREEMQAEAIDVIMNMDEGEFKRRRDEEKRKQLYKRRMGAKGKEQQLKQERERLREQGKDHNLVCGKCKAYACPSDDLRVIEGVHHVVIEEDFNENCRIEPDPERKTYAGWEQTEKMFCINCGHYWGPRCRYLNQMYPVIKIEQFIIFTPQEEMLKIQKWKDCPFYIEKYQLSMNDDA